MGKIKRIIWLENDIRFMINSEYLFNEYGFEIIKCISIAQALQAINNKESNFLLLDVDFPNSKKEGLIFLEELTIMHPNLKVVLFTGYPSSHDAVKSIRDLNAVDYIEKTVFIDRKGQIEFFRKLDSYFPSSDEKTKTKKSSWYKNEVIVAAIIGAIAVIIAAILPSIISSKTQQIIPHNQEKIIKSTSDTIKNKIK